MESACGSVYGSVYGTVYGSVYGSYTLSWEEDRKKMESPILLNCSESVPQQHGKPVAESSVVRYGPYTGPYTQRTCVGEPPWFVDYAAQRQHVDELCHIGIQPVLIPWKTIQ